MDKKMNGIENYKDMIPDRREGEMQSPFLKFKFPPIAPTNPKLKNRTPAHKTSGVTHIMEVHTQAHPSKTSLGK